MTWYGAFAGDRLVGVVGSEYVDDVALLRHAYVLPEWQRRGVGAALGRHAEHRIVGGGPDHRRYLRGELQSPPRPRAGRIPTLGGLRGRSPDVLRHPRGSVDVVGHLREERRSTMTTTLRASRRRLPLWLVVAAGGVITAISLGVRSTFGLFLDPVIESLDTDRGTFALAIAVQQIIWGVSQPLAGAVSDRFGAARVLAGGSLLYGIALILMSTASSAGMLILSAGFLTGVSVGAASFAVVLSAVGRMVPPERRMVSLGIVSAIGSLGQFALVPLARARIDATSWESAVTLLALVAFAALLFTPAIRGRATDFADPGTSADGDAPPPARRAGPGRARPPLPALERRLLRLRIPRDVHRHPPAVLLRGSGPDRLGGIHRPRPHRPVQRVRVAGRRLARCSLLRTPDCSPGSTAYERWSSPASCSSRPARD